MSWTLQNSVLFAFIIYYLFGNMFPDDGSDAQMILQTVGLMVIMGWDVKSEKDQLRMNTHLEDDCS